jgi:ankyrin repeat protein
MNVVRYHDELFGESCDITYGFGDDGRLVMVLAWFNEYGGVVYRRLVQFLAATYSIEEMNSAATVGSGPGVRAGALLDWFTGTFLFFVSFDYFAAQELGIEEDDSDNGFGVLSDQIIRGDTAGVARALLEQGDPNVLSPDGWRPITWAIWERQTEVVAAILEAGAEPAAANADGSTALHWAARDNQLDVIAMVEEAGVGVDVEDINGMTPLMSAAWSGHADSVKLLQQRGATPSASNAFGVTALHYAVHWADNPLTVRALIEGGADPNACSATGGFNGRTPLMVAVQSGSQRSVELLIAGGADPTIKDDDGDTPLILARREGYGSIEQVLLDAGAGEE